jgi:hypothetical protein
VQVGSWPISRGCDFSKDAKVQLQLVTENMAKAVEFFKTGSEKSHRECIFMYGHCLLSERNTCSNEDLGYEKMQVAAALLARVLMPVAARPKAAPQAE